MKKWLKILIILAVIGLIALFLVWKFMYNKPHTDYAKAKVDIEITAADLFKQYSENKTTSDSLYLDKVVQISGKISKIEQTDTSCIIVFVFKEGDFGDEGIRCSMLDDQKSKCALLKPEQEVKLKGHCTGYISDVIVEKCVIAE